MHRSDYVRVVVVLVDNCLSTYKIDRIPAPPWKNDTTIKSWLVSMAMMMDNRYFTEVQGKVISVVGRVIVNPSTCEEAFRIAEAWVRSFKAHPHQELLSYASVYCNNYQEWKDIYDGKFEIPIGEIDPTPYVPKGDEILIDMHGIN